MIVSVRNYSVVVKNLNGSVLSAPRPYDDLIEAIDKSLEMGWSDSNPILYTILTHPLVDSESVLESTNQST